MRLLFSAAGAHGHVYPLLPLADAARRAGHEVLFATDEVMFPTLHRANLDTVKTGIPIATAFRRIKVARSLPEDSDTDTTTAVGASVFGDLLPRTVFATTKPVIERFGPDLVICEIGNPGAWFAAEHVGVPAMGVTWGRVMSTPLNQVIAAITAKTAADLGVSGMVPYLDVCPESLQSESFRNGAERLPLRPVGWSFADEELPPVVTERERPLVYVTISSGPQTLSVPLLRDIVAGLSRLPVDVLVSTGSTAVDQMSGLPDNVHVRSWVPQTLVIPHTALVVHHGGPGCMLNALAAGVPQLVLPDTSGAEPGTGITIKECGAGDMLPQAEATVELVYEKAKALLDSEPAHQAAAELAREIAEMPSPEQVIELLETR